MKQETSQDDKAPPPTCRCVDWYAQGEARTVKVNGVRVTVRFVGRRGRRGRIAIEAPAGAEFASSSERGVR